MTAPAPEQLDERTLADRRRAATKVIAASFIGTAIEWYDFFLFGTMTAIALAPLFFPNSDPVASTLAGFLSFAAAFVARPIGAVVFGHYGDKLGRKGALIVTVILMGAASTLIGVLPTYETAGILAPILLTVLRFLQGIATGGEWGGATLMAMEYVEPRRKPLMAALVQLGSPVGTLLSTCAVAWVTGFSGENFLTRGWRLPFLFSIVLIAVAVWIRVGVEETPEFEETKQAEGTAKLPIWELLTTAGGRTLVGIAAYLVGNAGFFLFTTFMISYVTRVLGLPAPVILGAMTIGAVAQMVFTLIAGWVANRIGPFLTAVIGYAWFALIVFPVFWLVDTKDPALITVAMILVMGPGAISYAVIGSVLDRIFPTRLKYTGLAISGNVSALIAGFMPALATVVLTASGNLSWGPALLALAISLISLVGTLLAWRIVRRDEQRAAALAPAAEPAAAR